jgi:hypothetical protein
MAKRQTNDHDDLDLQQTQQAHDEIPYHSYPFPQTPQMPCGGRRLFSTGMQWFYNASSPVRLPKSQTRSPRGRRASVCRAARAVMRRAPYQSGAAAAWGTLANLDNPRSGVPHLRVTYIHRHL